jgi:uncharacterized RDD family membrane protein YckC
VIQTFAIAPLWRRVSAGLVDFLLVLVFMATFGWVCSLTKVSALVLFSPLCILPLIYVVLLHARYGATIGKAAFGIRVVRTDNSKIGLKEALRRSAVDGLFYAHWTLMVGIGVVSLPSESFSGQGWFSLFQELRPYFPAHFEDVDIASTVWSLSEFFTVLLNRRRRSVHDFIAGTIVVCRGNRDV